MSLRWRWAVGLGLVATLAIGLMTVAAIVSVERRLRGAMDEDLRGRATQVHELTGRLFEQGEEQREEVLPRIVNDAAVQVFDEDGAVLLRVGPAGVTPPVEATDLEVVAGARPTFLRDVRIGDNLYRMITVRIQLRETTPSMVVAVQILADQSQLESNLAALTGRLLSIGAVGVLLVALTGWIMASRAVRPISDLTHAAEHVATTEDLSAGERLDLSAPAEIGRLATAFRSMLNSLRVSRQEQQRLVSDAGHEFRTPITALKTNLEVLRRQDHRLSEEEQDELIEAALRESNQLAQLAAELVDLTSDVRHAAEPIQDVDLGTLARELRSRYVRVPGKEVTVAGGSSVVTGRRTQLERAMSNLADNGIKWAERRVEIVVEGGTFTVRDDGPGIPAEDLPHVFRRFYRSAEARTMPGSGLGLAIVDHLISANGGTVFARNSADGGAEVGFTLPPAEGGKSGGRVN
ncbi:MAG: HAMP domain-containing sensor histidine kinase [bacterium]|nr:HAMP domain-containing sensor histidine kinase [bacterium]